MSVLFRVTYYFDNSRFTSSDYFRNDTSNFAIREGYYAGGTVVMLIFCGIGGWLTGYALFWKVVITHEKVEYHSSFSE